MNDIQKSLLDSLSLVANSSAKNMQNTVTIEAEVISVEDSGLNSYKVNYMNNKFIAYANTPNVQYTQGDKVYVLVPNGDFSKEKIIIGTIKPSGNIFTTSSSDVSYHLEKSDNLFKNVGDISLCSYETEIQNISIDNNISYLLSHYFQKYKTLLLSFKVKTAIPKEQQVKGNYGLSLKIPYLESHYNQETNETIQEAALREYIFDINNIIGNPYDFAENTQQDFYISIDSNFDSNQDLEFSAFVRDFYQEEGHNDDIFISDISLKVVDILSETDKNGYFLSIAAERGEFFNKGEYYTTKKLTPILKLNGKDTNYKHLPCYWFIEDGSITEESEGYSLRGGRGWRCLNEKTEFTNPETGEKSFQYITNKFTYEVKIEDVIHTRRYKCVLVNTDFSLIANTIEIKNLHSDIEISLSTQNGDTQYLSNIGYVNLITTIKTEVPLFSSNGNIQYTWLRYDRAGKFLNSNFYEAVVQKDWSENDKTYKMEITFPTSIIEQVNTFYCFIKITDIDENGKYIEKDMGSVFINVTTTSSKEFNLLINNGDKLYKYDAYGNSPYVGNYDGLESSVVRNIEPLQYRILKKDGTEFTDSEYAFCKTTWIVPKSSMIRVREGLENTEDENYYYYQGMGRFDLPYTISHVFQVNNNNNDIQLKVEFNDTFLIALSSFKFLKDGQSGTNGTKYNAEIIYKQDINPCLLYMVYINNQGWYYFNYDLKKLISLESKAPSFTVNVYKSGEIFDPSKVKLQWEMFDTKTSKPCFEVNNGTLSVADNGNLPYDSCNIVQATIEVEDDAEKSEKLYAYFPINVIYLEDEISASEISTLPFIANGYKEVLYAADGTSPMYSQADFICQDLLIDEENKENELQYSYNWQISEKANLNIDTYNQASICTIKPKDIYDNINNIHYIKLDVTLSDYDKEVVADNLVNAKQEYEAVKNNYTLSQDKINFLTQKASEIKVADWYTKVGEAKAMLERRALCIEHAAAALQELEKLFVYCEERKELIQDIYNYNSFYISAKEKINEAINSLFAFGEASQGTDNLSTIVDLKDYKINLSLEQDQNLKKSLGTTASSVLKSTIGLYNHTIQSYISAYNTLQISGEEASAFVELITLLRDTLSDISSVYDAIINDLHNKELNFYTYNEIKYNFFSRLINNLQLYFDINENSTTVAKHYLNSLSEAELKEATEIAERKYNYWIKRADNLAIDHIICINPILLHYNRYELSNINGWDGNRIYTGTNDEFLYAPQVGAGHKENDNSFTGIIIGDKRNAKNPLVKDTGLFGYHRGEQSIFLNAKDGSATFGKSGEGQIILTPGEKAIIKSGNYDTSKKTGMQIDLTTPEIKWGNGKFKVDANGILTAVDGNFTGVITATGGNIAGWSIASSKDSNGKIIGTISNGYIKLDSTGGIEHTGGKWKLDNSGKATFKNADIEGIINAKAGGQIGGWSIGEKTLTGGNIVLNSAGSISNTTGKWSLNNDGSASFSDVSITGGGIKIGSGTQIFEVDRNGNVTLPSNAKITWGQVTGTENIASKTYVTSQGYETAQSIKDTVITKDYIETMKVRAGSVISTWVYAGNITAGQIKTGTITSNDGASTKLNLDDGTFTMGGGKLTWDKTTLTVTGKVNITDGGKIGTFYVVQSNDHSAIYNGTNAINSTAVGVYLGTNGIRNYKSETANVTIKDGVITANGANISGKLTAGSGSVIGGWSIGTNTITGGNTTLNSNGSISVGSNFSVSTSGVLTATSVNITSGTITGSATVPLAFGSWTFNGGDLYCYNSLYQLSTGISATGRTAFATGIAKGFETKNWYDNCNLAITHAGVLKASEIHITPGNSSTGEKGYVEGTGRSAIGNFTFYSDKTKVDARYKQFTVISGDGTSPIGKFQIDCGAHATSSASGGIPRQWRVLYNFEYNSTRYVWGVCICDPTLSSTYQVYSVVLGVKADGTVIK